MPVALACETPAGLVYLRTEPDGSFSRAADPSQADLWESAEALAAWIERLPEASRHRLEGRPIRVAEIDLDLDRGVTREQLDASAAFLADQRRLLARKGTWLDRPGRQAAAGETTEEHQEELSCAAAL